VAPPSHNADGGNGSLFSFPQSVYNLMEPAPAYGGKPWSPQPSWAHAPSPGLRRYTGTPDWSHIVLSLLPAAPTPATLHRMPRLSRHRWFSPHLFQIGRMADRILAPSGTPV
jgi:hypothetical protein